MASDRIEGQKWVVDRDSFGRIRLHLYYRASAPDGSWCEGAGILTFPNDAVGKDVFGAAESTRDFQEERLAEALKSRDAK
jgi:hypothetical protein